MWDETVDHSLLMHTGLGMDQIQNLTHSVDVLTLLHFLFPSVAVTSTGPLISQDFELKCIKGKENRKEDRFLDYFFLNASMNHQLIILQGGEDVEKRTNEALIRKVGELSATRKILVIPWTTESMEKETKYRTIFCDYFSDNGFRDVLFLEKEDTEIEVSHKFDSVDVVYLPGGDTDVLYRELELRSLQDRLRDFSGIIIGNSAGAIVLSKGSHHEKGFSPGFGLVKFFITVHFKIEKECVSRHFMNPSINIPEGGWLAISGEN